MLAAVASYFSAPNRGEHFKRPQSFVSKYESGERPSDPTELQAFARLYGKPIAFFLDGGGGAASPAPGGCPAATSPRRAREQRERGSRIKVE
jgi:hypothetical protein